MMSGKRARVAARQRRWPSMRVVIAIVVPTVALLAFLIVWAYRVHDWTWFSLLLAAAIGVSAFVVAPDLFSIKDSSAPEEWCLTMKAGAPMPDKLKGRAQAPTVGEHHEQHDRHAPNRSA